MWGLVFSPFLILPEVAPSFNLGRAVVASESSRQSGLDF